MFMDKKPKFIKPPRPRIRKGKNSSMARKFSIGKISKNQISKQSNQLHVTDSASE
jgi:hypothetical protein